MNNKAQSFFKIGIVGCLILGFAFYGLYKAKGFLSGPQIIINEPQNGQAFQGSYIKVAGQAKNIASIFLNGKPIFIDETGLFDENLLLARGYNIMEVKVVDKFGRITEERREVVLK